MEEQASLADLLEHGDFELTCWEDDDLALRMAACNGRHPYNAMTVLERRCFPDIFLDKAKQKIYLYVRGKILQRWMLEPNVEVTFYNVQDHMSKPFNEQSDIIRRCLAYLNRYGYINNGCYHLLTGILERKDIKRAVVIGAGISGIAAAKQLRKFGFNVTVLEAGNRIGGRIHSVQMEDKINIVKNKNYTYGYDLGAEILMGQQGNPLFSLMRQLSCCPVSLNNHVTLYDENGKLVEDSKTALTVDIYRKMCDSLLYLVNVKEVKTLEGEILSVQKIFDRLLAQLEFDTVKHQEHYYDNFLSVLNKLKATVQNIKELGVSADFLKQKADMLESMRDSGEANEQELELLTRFQYVDMNRFSRLYDTAKERRKDLSALIKEFKKNVPSSVFISPKERQILEWHYACIEGKLGTTLDQIPAEHFDPVHGEPFKENNLAFREGMGMFLRRLVANDKFSFNCTVNEINYEQKKVTVKYTKRDQVDGKVVSIEEQVTADAVVCTVPLGVLKKNTINFVPPLPENKREAISKMGFGVQNKVVLIFERSFWCPDQSFFGHLNPNAASRGEFYMFTAIGTKPVLTAHMGGSSAILDQPNEVIVNNAMTILKNIYGTAVTPKQPKQAFVTRWHLDKKFYGTTSFVQVGGDYAMYDTLASPVAGPASANQPSLYFAGEHTNRTVPASVPGAWLSGIRVAAEVADSFFGQPFAKRYDDAEAIEISDDDEEAAPPADSSQTSSTDPIPK